jgi:hypothetical protein
MLNELRSPGYYGQGFAVYAIALSKAACAQPALRSTSVCWLFCWLVLGEEAGIRSS